MGDAVSFLSELFQLFLFFTFSSDDAVGFLLQGLFILYDGGVNFLEFSGISSFKGIVKILKGEGRGIHRTNETVFHLRGQEFLIVFSQCYIMVDTDTHTYPDFVTHFFSKNITS